MSKAYDYDLIVIGSGPAGEKGAAQAAYFGKKVAVIERADHVGGAGINTGTVPSKTLRETALYFSGLKQRGLYGIDYSLKDGLTVSSFMYRKKNVVENQWEIITKNLDRHGIELIQGEASLSDSHTIQVRHKDGSVDKLSADKILIATGSSPYCPPDVPVDHSAIFDSDSILKMVRIPHSMTIVGGGVIGSEYAGIFAALGVKVTLVDGRQRLLPFVDAEIAQRLRESMENIGLRLIFNERVAKTERIGGKVIIHLEGCERLESEIALFASGRKSNVEGLGLNEVGVKLGDRGLILVNEKYQTSVPNIFAAGDVIGFPALASTSMEQARVAMVHAFDLKYKEAVARTIPLAVYTIPEIAMVGVTEEECLSKNTSIAVGRAYYESSARGQIIGDLNGMIKLIASPADRRLLGVHIIGEMASELVHLGAQVMSEQGSIDSFIDATYNYPSLTECYKYAAYDALGQIALGSLR